MGEPLLLQIRFHNTVPVFAMPATCAPEALRAFGATLSRPLDLWLFPAFHPFGQRVVADLKIIFGDRLVLSLEAKGCLEYLETVPKLIEERHIPDGYKFATEPMDHQLEALCHTLYSPRFGLFAEMGLGKTKVSIDTMEILHLSQPDLKWIVLVSRAGLYVWETELLKHGSGKLGCFTLDGTPKKKMGMLEKAVVDREKWLFMVATYESAKNLEMFLPHLRFKGLIADESHKIRRTQSANQKATNRLAAQTGRRLLLSGTPALGDPMHIWSQFQVLAPFVLTRNRRKFVDYHVVHASKAKANRHIVVGFKNMEALNRAIQPLARRYKQEDCMDLPERTITVRSVKPDRSIRKYYNQLIEDAVTEINGKEIIPGNAAVIVAKLQQLCSGFVIVPQKEALCDGCPRLDYCVKTEPLIKPYTKRCEIDKGPAPIEIERIGKSQKLLALEGILDEALHNPTSKVLIWCTFTEELNILEGFLKERSDSCVRVDGSVSAKNVRDRQKQFQEDETIRVYLAQVATGESVTLTAADYMVYYSLSFRLDHYLQAMARNFRRGQERKTFVYLLVTKGSVEEYIHAVLDRKTDISESMTARINCVLCERQFDCLVNGIEPFTAKCKYLDEAGRVRIRPKHLPYLG